MNFLSAPLSVIEKRVNFLSAPLSVIEKRVSNGAHVNAAHHWHNIIKAEMEFITRIDPENEDPCELYAARDASHYALACDLDDSFWVRIIWIDHRTRECFELNAHSLVDGGDVPESESFPLDGSGYDQKFYQALKNA